MYFDQTTDYQTLSLLNTLEPEYREHVQQALKLSARVEGKTALFYSQSEYTKFCWSEQAGDAFHENNFYTVEETDLGKYMINLRDEMSPLKSQQSIMWQIASRQMALQARGDVMALCYDSNTPKCFDWVDFDSQTGDRLTVPQPMLTGKPDTFMENTWAKWELPTLIYDNRNINSINGISVDACADAVQNAPSEIQGLAWVNRDLGIEALKLPKASFFGADSGSGSGWGSGGETFGDFIGRSPPVTINQNSSAPTSFYSPSEEHNQNFLPVVQESFISRAASMDDFFKCVGSLPGGILSSATATIKNFSSLRFSCEQASNVVIILDDNLRFNTGLSIEEVAILMNYIFGEKDPNGVFGAITQSEFSGANEGNVVTNLCREADRRLGELILGIDRNGELVPNNHRELFNPELEELNAIRREDRRTYQSIARRIACNASMNIILTIDEIYFTTSGSDVRITNAEMGWQLLGYERVSGSPPFAIDGLDQLRLFFPQQVLNFERTSSHQNSIIRKEPLLEKFTLYAATIALLRKARDCNAAKYRSIEIEQAYGRRTLFPFDSTSIAEKPQALKDTAIYKERESTVRLLRAQLLAALEDTSDLERVLYPAISLYQLALETEDLEALGEAQMAISHLVLRDPIVYPDPTLNLEISRAVSKILLSPQKAPSTEASRLKDDILLAAKEHNLDQLEGLAARVADHRLAFPLDVYQALVKSFLAHGMQVKAALWLGRAAVNMTDHSKDSLIIGELFDEFKLPEESALLVSSFACASAHRAIHSTSISRDASPRTPPSPLKLRAYATQAAHALLQANPESWSQTLQTENSLSSYYPESTNAGACFLIGLLILDMDHALNRDLSPVSDRNYFEFVSKLRNTPIAAAFSEAKTPEKSLVRYFHYTCSLFNSVFITTQSARQVYHDSSIDMERSSPLGPGELGGEVLIRAIMQEGDDTEKVIAKYEEIIDSYKRHLASTPAHVVRSEKLLFLNWRKWLNGTQIGKLAAGRKLFFHEAVQHNSWDCEGSGVLFFDCARIAGHRAEIVRAPQHILVRIGDSYFETGSQDISSKEQVLKTYHYIESAGDRYYDLEFLAFVTKHVTARDRDEKLQVARAAVSEFGFDSNVHAAYGLSLNILSEREEAFQALQKALTLNPLNHLGYDLARKLGVKGASSASLELGVSSPLKSAIIAEERMADGLPSETAIPYFSAAIYQLIDHASPLVVLESKPELMMAKALCQRAYLFEQIGMVNESIRDACIAVWAAPDFPEARNIAARALYKGEQYSLAYDFAIKSAQKFPEIQNLYIVAGYCALRIGRIKETPALFSQALTLATDDKDRANLIKMIIDTQEEIDRIEKLQDEDLAA